MRLINASTLDFHEFLGSRLTSLPYAILSHTWGDEEVSYQEMRHLTDETKSRNGYAKIINAAKQAVRDGLDWLWVDTCCIDKSSSAELTEAINSMYKWYERSTLCYAYLEDVDANLPIERDSAQFAKSRWFTRGWTLQELVAPKRVIFYSRLWKQIGEKVNRSTLHTPDTTTVTRVWGSTGRRLLSLASGIPDEVLFEGRSKDTYSVAQRMSWASSRVCTRSEDTAYSLMGLFNIHMPLLYGEEEQAFTRLQEEIIRTTDDHSIFAWKLPKDDMVPWSCHPVLATSPRLFAGCDGVTSHGREAGRLSAMTKHGLMIESILGKCDFPIKGHVAGRADVGCYQMILNCYDVHGQLQLSMDPDRRFKLGLWLIGVDSGRDDGGGLPAHYYRIATTDHQQMHVSSAMQQEWREAYETLNVRPIYIAQKLVETDVMTSRSRCVFQFSDLPSRIETPGHPGGRPHNQHTADTGYMIECADHYTMASWSQLFNGFGSEPSEDLHYAGMPPEPGFIVTRPHVLVITRRKPQVQGLLDPGRPLSCFLLVFRAMVPYMGTLARPHLLARVTPVYKSEKDDYHSDLMFLARVNLGHETDPVRAQSKLVRYEADDLGTTLAKLDMQPVTIEFPWGSADHYPPQTLEMTVDCQAVDSSQGDSRFCFQFSTKLSPVPEVATCSPVQSDLYWQPRADAGPYSGYRHSY